jgi:hypothetical protein
MDEVDIPNAFAYTSLALKVNKTCTSLYALSNIAFMIIADLDNRLHNFSNIKANHRLIHF